MCLSRLIWKFFKKALFLEGTGTPYSHSLISLPFVPVLYPPSFIASSSLVHSCWPWKRSIAAILPLLRYKKSHKKPDRLGNVEKRYALYQEEKCWKTLIKCMEICVRIVSRGEMLINISKMHGNMFPYCIKRRNADKH